MGSLNIFFKKYTKKSHFDCNEYLIIKILFFKIKFKKTPSQTNEVYFNEKKISLKKLKNIKRNIKLYIAGENNIVKLPSIELLNNFTLYLNGSNNSVTIENPYPGRFTGVTIVMDGQCNNRKVYIGENCLANGSLKIHCNGHGKKVEIGKNCMFAISSDIRTSDFHSIYEINNNTILNEPKDVLIGDHVWLTNDCIVGKGAIIPDGCIVAIRSFVNKKFEESNCILAGLPAKIVKRNIRWEK